MPHFTSENTFGYEPAGIKLLNRVFDKVIEAVRAAATPAARLSDDEIAAIVLDVCYADHGNIDVKDLARQVLAKLG